MKSNISVPISTELFLKLADRMRRNDDQRDPVYGITLAIEAWLGIADLRSSHPLETDALGYQWKILFLPHGTKIRMQYCSKYYYANVESDKLVYEGKSITPAALAKHISGSERNAWRDLWIMRPNDMEWMLAEQLRKQRIEQMREIGEKLLAEF